MMFKPKKLTKCKCSPEFQIGVEYHWNMPEHYDGISEWNCTGCNRRWGRWSGTELKGEEREGRYGQVKGH